MNTHGKSNQPDRSANGILLSLAGAAQIDRNLHLSPILRQIRDDGPAKPDSAPGLPAHKDKSISPPPPPVVSLTPIPGLPVKIRSRLLLQATLLVLTLALGATAWFTWQQQQRIETLENLMQQTGLQSSDI